MLIPENIIMLEIAKYLALIGIDLVSKYVRTILPK